MQSNSNTPTLFTVSQIIRNEDYIAELLAKHTNALVAMPPSDSQKRIEELADAAGARYRIDEKIAEFRREVKSALQSAVAEAAAKIEAATPYRAWFNATLRQELEQKFGEETAQELLKSSYYRLTYIPRDPLAPEYDPNTLGYLELDYPAYEPSHIAYARLKAEHPERLLFFVDMDRGGRCTVFGDDAKTVGRVLFREVKYRDFGDGITRAYVTFTDEYAYRKSAILKGHGYIVANCYPREKEEPAATAEHPNRAIAINRDGGAHYYRGGSVRSGEPEKEIGPQLAEDMATEKARHTSEFIDYMIQKHADELASVMAIDANQLASYITWKCHEYGEFGFTSDLEIGEVRSAAIRAMVAWRRALDPDPVDHGWGRLREIMEYYEKLPANPAIKPTPAKNSPVYIFGMSGGDVKKAAASLRSTYEPGANIKYIGKDLVTITATAGERVISVSLNDAEGRARAAFFFGHTYDAATEDMAATLPLRALLDIAKNISKDSVASVERIGDGYVVNNGSLRRMQKLDSAAPVDWSAFDEIGDTSPGVYIDDKTALLTLVDCASIAPWVNEKTSTAVRAVRFNTQDQEYGGTLAWSWGGPRAAVVGCFSSLSDETGATTIPDYALKAAMIADPRSSCSINIQWSESRAVIISGNLWQCVPTIQGHEFDVPGILFRTRYSMTVTVDRREMRRAIESMTRAIASRCDHARARFTLDISPSETWTGDSPVADFWITSRENGEILETKLDDARLKIDHTVPSYTNARLTLDAGQLLNVVRSLDSDTVALDISCHAGMCMREGNRMPGTARERLAVMFYSIPEQRVAA